jgi:hypothetical protein
MRKIVGFGFEKWKENLHTLGGTFIENEEPGNLIFSFVLQANWPFFNVFLSTEDRWV